MSKGFNIKPKLNCPHIAENLPDEIGAFQYPNACATCGSTEENWVCLKCGQNNCSRYVCGHAGDHAQLHENHCIAISWSDCSAWCYACSEYIDGQAIRPFIRAVQTAKFDTHPTATTAAPPTTAPPPVVAAAAAATTTPENVISEKGSEINITDAVAADNLKFDRCKGCKATITGTGLGNLTLKSSSQMGVVLKAPQTTGSVIRIEGCTDVVLTVPMQCGHVFVEKSNHVTLSFPAGWTVVHTWRSSGVAIAAAGQKSLYKIRASMDRPIATQSYKGTIFSEYADGGKAEQEDEEEEEMSGDGEPVTVPKNRQKLGHATEEEIKEIYDTYAQVEEAVTKLAALIQENRGNVVVYTGAGISTSSRIPDYRGPTGVWTLQDKGQNVRLDVSFEEAVPSVTHMAITELVKQQVVKFVVSTNVDGLHLASGLPIDKLAELHGNAFLERCNKCKAAFLRPWDVQTHKGPDINPNERHSTGRKCDKCSTGELVDSIVHFGEQLPQSEVSKALTHQRSAVSLVLGTSMMVHPACDLPPNAAKMVIVNLQKTPFDDQAALRIFAKTDLVMQKLMDKLSLPIPPCVRHPIIQ